MSSSKLIREDSPNVRSSTVHFRSLAVRCILAFQFARVLNSVRSSSPVYFLDSIFFTMFFAAILAKTISRTPGKSPHFAAENPSNLRFDPLVSNDCWQYIFGSRLPINSLPGGASHHDSLASKTINGAVAQLVRVLDCRSSGCGFEPRRRRFFLVGCVAKGFCNSIFRLF